MTNSYIKTNKSDFNATFRIKQDDIWKHELSENE